MKSTCNFSATQCGLTPQLGYYVSLNPTHLTLTKIGSSAGSYASNFTSIIKISVAVSKIPLPKLKSMKTPQIALQGEKGTEEESNFCQDIVVEILCRLPKKSLARFKSVSKQWLTLISDRNYVSPKTTHLGIVCQSYMDIKDRDKDNNNNRSRMAFFHVDLEGKGSAYLEYSSVLGITIRQQHGRLLSSCNGFLLFHDYLSPNNKDYVVCHPATNRSWLIFPPKDQRISCVGLASEGNHFKVVFIAHDARSNIVSQIFSSQNRKWSKEFTPHCVAVDLCICVWWPARSVFIGGFLHWIWSQYCIFSNCLLTCNLEDGHCQFLSLPGDLGYRSPETQCIWESEGCLNYCNVCPGNRIGIWTLCKENWSSNQNQYLFRWKVKHNGIITPPSSVDDHGISLFLPVAFNDDFGIVYLEYINNLFSYNLATQEVKEACMSPFEGLDLCGELAVLPFSYLTQVEVAQVMRNEELCNPCSSETLKRRKLL